METIVQQEKKIEKKEFIIGKQNPNALHSLKIGRFYALDGSLGASISIDVSKPHVILIAGKRGYGKSYTIGVFLEEFSRLNKDVKNKYCCIIIDTLGIYWTMAYPNIKQKEILSKWHQNPDGCPVTLYQTIYPTKNKGDKNQLVKLLQIPPNILSIDQWYDLFQFSLIQAEAILLSSSIMRLQNQQIPYSIKDIIKENQKNQEVKKETIQTLNTLLRQVENWNIFRNDIDPIDDLINPGEITIIDLSQIHSIHLKQTITGIIAELLFYYRIDQRRKEENNMINNRPNTEQQPYIYFCIDEAHLFIPKAESSYVKKILLHNWLRQGRQPGLSVILATQRPSFMDQEVLSHCDLFLCHRVTAHDDIESLTKIRPTYMNTDLKSIIKKIGSEKGVALLIDDVVEASHIIKIRPRYSWHGGGEPDEKMQMPDSQQQTN